MRNVCSLCAVRAVLAVRAQPALPLTHPLWLCKQSKRCACLLSAHNSRARLLRRERAHAARAHSSRRYSLIYIYNYNNCACKQRASIYLAGRQVARGPHKLLVIVI